MNSIERMAKRVSEQMERDFGPAPCADQAARKHVEGFRWAGPGEDSVYGVTVGAGTAANDNRARLDTLPPGIVYLGSPYTLYPHGLHRAAREAAIAAGRLMEIGLVVYAPIPHGHNIACWGDLPATWEFWKKQCQPYIDAASSLVVLKLEGWQDSVGLTYEIEEFERQGKPVAMMTLDEVLALRGRDERRAA